MKIWQLYEVSQQQVATLRPNSIVDLYYPASVQTTMDLINGRYQDTDPMTVTMSLKTAAEISDVVIHFWTLGKYLEAPRNLRKSAQDKEIAASQYPESFDPILTLSLLSQRPMTILKRYPMPENIQAVYINWDEEMKKMQPSEFLEWFIKLVRRSRERGLDIESRLNERYNNTSVSLNT